MAKMHGKNVRVFYHGYDVSADLNSISFPNEFDTADVSGFGEESKNYVLGQKDVSVTWDGFFNTAANANHALATADLGGTVGKVLTAVVGTTPASPGFAGSAEIVTRHESAISIGGAVPVSTTFMTGPTNGPDIVWLLEKTISTAGTGAAYDDTASTTGGIRAYANVLGVTGTATIKIQHGTTSSGPWVDLITFTDATGPTSEGKETTGTVNQFLRRNISAGTAAVVLTFTRL